MAESRSRNTMLLFLRALVILLAVAMVSSLFGCAVRSKFKTRSFMTEDELREIDEIYHPSGGEGGAADQREIAPFLQGVEGPAIKVNGIDIAAADIRRLYEYQASFSQEDPNVLKGQACFEWIRTYAVMSQWPDTVSQAQQRLNDIRSQVENGADFVDLILEYSQEPMIEQTAGDLGERGRGVFAPIFEMHAFTDPVGEVVGPFPTIFGWHLIQVLDRDMSADQPVTHCRHLLLYHGLNPDNGDQITRNLERWTNLATVELLAPELNEVLPRFARPEEGAQESGVQEEGSVEQP